MSESKSEVEKRTLIVLRASTGLKTKDCLGECSWAFSFCPVVLAVLG